MVQLYKRKGGDVIVNTATLNNQSGGNISLLPGGGFVVVWVDGSLTGTDTTGFGIKAQRFDADGNKIGTEFLVNTTTAGNQTGATVATLVSGRFVVTWTDGSASGGDTSSNAVRAQIFEANGTPVGGEFLVNTVTTGNQSTPAITELSGGGFVISWTDGSATGTDTSSNGIKAQIYDAAGAPVGGEFLLNTETTGSQTVPSVIGLATGGFAAIWQGPTTATGGGVTGSVRLQLFDSAGGKVGSEQVVNAGNDGNFNTPTITALANGFIVTWTQQDSVFAPGIPNTFDVHAQLFDANGVKVGGDFVVNTTTMGTQSAADVDQLPGGGFLVTWQGPGAGTNGTDIFGQIFDATGARVGPEFVVATGDDSQTGARVDVLPSGDIVITWTEGAPHGDDGASTGVKLEILTLTTDAPTDIALSGTVISETAREGAGLATLTSTGAINSSFTYQIVSDSTGGAFGIDGDKLVVLDNSLLDAESVTQVEVRIRTTDMNGHSYEETFQLDIADTPETGYGPVPAGEFLINTSTTGDQVEPALTTLASGGFLATWVQAPNGPIESKGQLYDADGDAVGGELSLNSATAVAALDNGGFVAAGTAPDGDSVGIIVTFYDAAGVATTAAIPVNTTTANEQSGPSITELSNGNIIVTWTDFTLSTFQSVVRAQVLDSAGNKVGVETTIPAIPAGSDPQVVALADGGYVVTWGDGSLQAQIFTDAGVRYGPQLTVAEFGTAEPYLTALAGGGFVVVWSGRVETEAGFDNDAIGARIYDAQGNPVGDTIMVATDEQTQVHSLDVAALPWGGFVVAWSGNDNPGGSPADAGIRAQVFDGTGAALGTQLVVNTETMFSQIEPDVIALPSGDFVIAWADQSGVGADTSGFGIKGRTFSVVPPPNPTPGPDTLDGTINADTIDGLAGNDVIHGHGGNDVLRGGADNDQLFGGIGNDTLDGGTGADHLEGGTGNDLYYIDTAGDVIVEAAGEGSDRVFARTSYTLAAGVSVETLSTDNNAGTAAVNLTGNELVNTLFGNAGANSLDGKAGADTMAGFAGNDLYYVDNAGDRIAENAGEGTDRVFASISYTLGAGVSVETLSTDFAPGTAAINLIGNELANNIFGNAGANSLDGKGGADTLAGFGGNDLYYVDNAADRVNEASGEGTDRVFASVSYALAAGAAVETLSTTNNAGTAAINLTGNELANNVFGNAGANSLDGKAGADTLAGFVGNDLYYVDNAGDRVVEASGEGTDRVFASTSYVLAAAASVETLSTDNNAGTAAINLTGNELVNTLFGNAGANTLDGKAGADTMAGLAGNDFYYVDNAADRVIEAAGEGTDRIFASTSYTLAAGASVETLGTTNNAATTAINLTGNELGNSLIGNAGANTLDGKAGIDTMIGLAGDDFYQVDNGADRVVEAAGEGSDQVFTSVSYTLAAGQSVEILSTNNAAGTTAINLTGNELVNHLIGNDGANVLDGKGGGDALEGGGGADSFVFSAALNSGIDFFIDFASGTDKILLDHNVFTGLPLGQLSGSAFSDSGANDADDRILYNPGLGFIAFDADGNGPGGAINFAILQPGGTVTASDFFVI